MGLRTFIAIEVPEDVRSAIYETIAPLRVLLADSVKWVRPENIHLTIKFLGDTPDEGLHEIEASIVKASEGTGPVHAEVRGFGVFPDTRRPSVLWFGLQAPPALLELRQKVERALGELGFEEDTRDFRAHLTVGRIRQGARVPKKRLASEICRLEDKSLGTMDIGEIILMKSELKPQGPLYTRIFSSRL